MLVFSFCDINDLARLTAVDRFWRLAAKDAWTRQTSLKLTGNMLRKGLNRIIQELCGASLKTLVLRGLGKSNEEIGAAVSCLSSLTAIDELIVDGQGSPSIYLCDEKSEELHASFASALSHLSSLHSLSLRCCHITPIGMLTVSPILGQFVHLKSLDLSWNRLRNDGISFALFCTIEVASSSKIFYERLLD